MPSSLPSRFIDRVYGAVCDTVDQESFDPLLVGFVEAFETLGVPVDRMQIPMTKLNGFRHPTLGAVIMTWRRDQGVSVQLVSHKYLEMNVVEERLSGTPYFALLFEGATSGRYDLRRSEQPFPILAELRSEGLVDYYASTLTMPDGSRQVISVCSGDEEGLGEHLDPLFRTMEPVLASALYNTYLSSVCRQIADTYIGQITGPRVLAGEIGRGSRNRLEAGIMFCDVRGFTAMSEKLGGDEVVPVMNEIFDRIGHCIDEEGGEILKFIGDAMLIVFPADDHDSRRALGRVLIDTARSAVAAVKTLGEQMDMPLSVGFGAHIGEVVYGNIGTHKRLDFTVMGPAVNLTSRLESLCKPLQASLAVSQEVCEGNEELLSDLGEHPVKGISRPVRVWGIPD